MHADFAQLEMVSKNKDIACYRHVGPHVEKIHRFVVSTPETRNILNHPEIVGHSFRRGMKDAIVKVLNNFPMPEVLEDLEDSKSNVLCFLRGGLNFNIADALGEAFGFEKQTTSYMTSQRDKDKYGRWFIKDAQYQKFVFENNATVFCGDIVATGSTIANGLECLIQNTRNSGKNIRNFVFFTIGCHKIEKLLEEAHDAFKKNFKNFENVIVIYFEGKFHLADSNTDVELKTQGTDLMRRHALMTPEFLLSQYDDLIPCLEQCVIYDGGSRSFNVRGFTTEVMNYWLAVRRLALHGRSLREYLLERFPDEWLATTRTREELQLLYPGISDETINQLIEARRNRWENDEILKIGDAAELEKIAMERVRILELMPVVKKASLKVAEK